jgi:hypothetical protein
VAVDFGPASLCLRSARQMDVIYIAQIELFISAKDSRKFAAHFLSIKVCGNIFQFCVSSKSAEILTAGIHAYSVIGSLPVITNLSNTF